MCELYINITFFCNNQGSNNFDINKGETSLSIPHKKYKIIIGSHSVYVYNKTIKFLKVVQVKI